MIRRQRELQQLAQRYGATLTRTRNSHWRFHCPDGPIIIASLTPSDSCGAPGREVIS